MIFSSISFIFFFFIFVFFIKYLSKFQNYIIIFFSLFFYAYWDFKFIFLILYLLLATYYLIKLNLRILFSSLLILAPLFFFKYSLFLSELIGNSFLIKYSYTSELPLAISFISFTCLAAVIDVKKNIFIKEDLNLNNFSQFILYFPQLVAGPILRLKDLIYVFKKKIYFDINNIKFGIFLFIIGFVKKIYLADNIGAYIDPIFADLEGFDPNFLFKAFMLFPLQIYYDFSGYVDMALGISSILSINLPINFNKPYLTHSLTDFWRNWHITLSNWFRDYLYIPLGGSKKGNFFKTCNLIITMTIAGLWHGASLNFLLWGFLNGLILSLEKIFLSLAHKRIINIIINCFIVFNLWIVFRIPELNSINLFYKIFYSNIFSFFNLSNFLLLLFVITMIYIQKFEDMTKMKRFAEKLNIIYLIPPVLIIIVLGLGMNAGQSEKFIYFDF